MHVKGCRLIYFHSLCSLLYAIYISFLLLVVDFFSMLLSDSQPVSFTNKFPSPVSQLQEMQLSVSQEVSLTFGLAAKKLVSIY